MWNAKPRDAKLQIDEGLNRRAQCHCHGPARVSVKCGSWLAQGSQSYIDARHRGLLAACTQAVQLFTDITKANQSCSRQTLSSALVKCPTAEIYPVLGTLMLIIRHLLSPALHRGGHAQEGAHHSSADRKASNMQAHRQHPSVLLARQLFPGFQDDQKEVCGLAGCGMSKQRVEKMTTPRRTSCHPARTTPCQPVRNPNLDDLDAC